MAIHPPVPRAAALLFALAASAHAQDPTLRPITVTVTGGNAAPADFTGFADVPLRDVPAQATVVDQRQVREAGARRLADLTRFHASVSDAYNAPGYWDFLSIRGFTLDNRFNYRREGLPVSAETVIPLDNKERIEILKGTSGIQAGTSAPGGLVNYVVKRPTQQDLRAATLEWTQGGGALGAVDLGGRFGVDGVFGYRLNVAAERLRPRIRNLDGQRQLLAFAGDWRLGRDTLLEGEVEWSHRAQGSQSGFSLLGNALPGPVDPGRNLNDQPWLQRSQFDGLTGTLRLTQALGADWRWSAQLGTQRLRTDDYTAFPFGCGAEGNFDRFCSDGSFDYYDFRSEDERRRQHAASLNLKGRLATGAATHDLSFGVLASRVRNRFGPQVFNYAGGGHIDGSAVTPPAPLPEAPGTDRDERSLEFSASDAIQWGPRLTTWLGLRHTVLERSTVLTDGTARNAYDQRVTTPWLAASYRLGAGVLAYASWGRGVESQQVPANALYANQGQVLPALKSTQAEIGLRGGDAALGWNIAAFRIERPVSNIDFCNRTFAACVGAYDGQAVHRGLEASAQWARGPWQLWGGVTLLDAQRRNSVAEPASNGQAPANVPDHALRASAGYRVAALPGLSLRGSLSHEGRRAVLADNSVRLPSWTRVDAALRYERRVGTTATTWTVGMDNVFDRRYWKESPYQFGHVYLYPGAPRTLRVAFHAEL
ncbi:MAG: TonB-dependent siderophore receptor [Ramlibacter sp.]